MTPLVYIMPRGTAQIDDVSTWLPPSLDIPWQSIFFEYINIVCIGNLVCCSPSFTQCNNVCIGDLVRCTPLFTQCSNGGCLEEILNLYVDQCIKYRISRWNSVQFLITWLNNPCNSTKTIKPIQMALLFTDILSSVFFAKIHSPVLFTKILF